MNLTLITTQNCSICYRVENFLKKFVFNNNSVTLTIIDSQYYNKKGIVIVPALLIDDELFSYGDVDELRLKDYIPKS